MSQAFGDLEGVETDVDDILVWGATEENTATMRRNKPDPQQREI